MTRDNIISKVQKLLRMAEHESSNANEAAIAAAQAQRLIDEHNLDAALLQYDGAAAEEPDEPIYDFGSKGAPLDADSPTKLVRWKTALATTITKLNGCALYVNRGVFHIVGRPSDADTVRYMYAYLSHETERLCKKDGAGCGRTWKNNYRLGVVDTLRSRLEASKKEFVEKKQEEAFERDGGAQGMALARINFALDRVEQRQEEATDFMYEKVLKKPRRTKPRKPLSQGREIKSARRAGQEAGATISINAARAALGDGQ